MYTDHFGLTDRPFQLTPDARYWFDSRTHKRAMAYLGYGLTQGEGFVVVTGEIGAGKSTLVAHLTSTIDRSRTNVLTIVSTQVDGDDVLRLVAHGLGLEIAGIAKAQLLDAVEQKLLDEGRAGKRTLLIVDEAQNLPVSALEELRMLSNFQTGGRALIQVLLTGQPEFRDRLRQPGLEQLRQRVIATHHLEAMEEGEIEPYIIHRLTCAGWRGRPSFEPGAFAAIHRHTDGIPRRINQLANRLLLHAALERIEMIGAGAVEAVAADQDADQQQPAPLAEPAAEERVLPLRSRANFTLVPQSEPEQPRAEPVPEQAPSSRETMLEKRLEALEEQLESQDRALRRVLSLLVDWVEGDANPAAFRNRQF